MTCDLWRLTSAVGILCCVSITVGGTTVTNSYLEERVVAKKDMDFPINADNNTQMFIIFTQQRSGSGYLTRVLRSRWPYINVQLYEPLGQIVHQYHRAYRSFGWAKIQSKLDNIFLQRCNRRPSTTPTIMARTIENPPKASLACGFKMMYNQLNPLMEENFLRWARKHHILVIHLVRLNVIRRLISLAYLRNNHSRTQVSAAEAARLGQDFEEPKVPLPQLSVEFLQRGLNIMDMWRWRLRQFNRGYHLEVDYEEMLTQAPGAHVDFGDDMLAPVSTSTGSRLCAALLGFLHPLLATLPCTLREDSSTAQGKKYTNTVVQQHGQYKCNASVKHWSELSDSIDKNPSTNDTHPGIRFALADCAQGEDKHTHNAPRDKL